MNEKDMQKIMEDSLLSPSDNFTDELINKINLEANAVKKFWQITILIGVFSLALFVFLFQVKTNVLFEISYLSYTIKISKFLIQIFGVLFILYEVYQLLELHKDLLIFKRNNALQNAG